MSLEVDAQTETSSHGSEQRQEAPAHNEQPTLVHTKPLLDDVLRHEADHANRDYAPFADQLHMSPAMFRKYALPSDLSDWRQLAAVLLGNVAGSSLLDFGCGMGEESVYFATLGAHVTAIDISEVGIATTKRRAQYHNLDIRAFEMRCDPTSFPSESFDRIHGMGILHHVGIESALAEAWRLLKPGGIGVFLEPLGDHSGIEAVKTFLMKHARFLGDFDEVTDHEHNLTWREVATGTQHFTRTLVFPYHLFYRLKRFMPVAIYPYVRRVDHALLTIAPSLRRFAGAVAIQVTK